jgi:hypothetical protein
MMRRLELGRNAVVLTGLVLLGCPAEERNPSEMTGIGSLTISDDGGSLGDDGSADGGGVTGADATSDATADDGGMIDTKFDVGNNGGGPPSAEDCMTDVALDDDGDGFSEADGDCNDCDPNVNPGAIEVINNQPDGNGMIPDPADEDCDGLVDNVPPPCDGGYAIDDANPFNAAAAMDLCKVAVGPDDWGVVNAQWVRANGAAAGGATAQFGILNDFGPNVSPQGGSQMLVLSSGRARIPGQAGNCGSLTCTGTGGGTAPAGFPQDVPACAGSSAINDDIALEVTIRAPTNATGYKYNFDFYSFEYPEWVCTAYNDQYIALVNPPPVGSINGNISFDAMTNPVSVNIAFFDVCAGCALGTAELSGNGFDIWDDAGATSWLETTAPVDPGTEFTIRFTIWDTGDAAWDSTVLIDGFQWIADGGTVTVGTQPEG